MKEFKRFKNLVFIFAALGICSCDSSTNVAPGPIASAPPVQAAKPATPPSTISFPFAEELQQFQQERVSAVPMGDVYPEDANALIQYKSGDDTFVTTGLGVAIWKGDRAQVEKYIAGGADLKLPIWYAGSTEIHRSSAAHMAINAVYTKTAQPDFFAYILAQGANTNEIATSYALSDGTISNYSQGSVLFHTVTSEIPELTKAVLDAGVSDLNAGVIGANGNTMSPLTMCVVRANVQGAKLLLEAGVDPASVPSDLVKKRLPGDPEQTKRREEIEALISTHTKPASQ
jgi:hypothetical protein